MSTQRHYWEVLSISLFLTPFVPLLSCNLNSNSLDIDEALYLQEEVFPEKPSVHNYRDNLSQGTEASNESAAAIDINDIEDDLSEFDWENAKQHRSAK